MRKKASRAGYEPDQIIARLLPHGVVAGTVTPLIGYWCFSQSGVDDPSALGLALYVALGLVLATWLAAVGVAIACISYRICRGPARYADSYRLPDSPRPKTSALRTR
jgi:hypothetical protein